MFGSGAVRRPPEWKRREGEGKEVNEDSKGLGKRIRGYSIE